MTRQTRNLDELLARNLDELLAHMKADHPSLGDWSYIPTFGGHAPGGACDLLSWDESRALIGTCPEDVQLFQSAVATPAEDTWAEDDPDGDAWWSGSRGDDW